MSYIIPIHKPSSVRHALKLRLLNADEDCIVLAKSNYLEILIQTPDGLQQVMKKRIHGKITLLEKVKPPMSSTDHLLIGTMCGRLLTISYNESTSQLQAEIDLSENREQGILPAHTPRQCFVDPTGTYFCLSFYEGTLSFMRIPKAAGRRKSSGLDSSYLDGPENRRITELSIRNMTFIHAKAKDTADLAILHSTTDGEIELVVYTAFDSKQYSEFQPKTDRKHKISIRDGGANLLIPIPPPNEEDYKRKYTAKSANSRPALGGVVVVGETYLTYFDADDTTPKTQMYLIKKPNVFVAWEAIDNLRYILADETGGLHLLTVRQQDGEVEAIDLIEMKDVNVSTPTAIISLAKDRLFIASHVGNSQLVHLNLANSKGPSFTVVQEMLNIAPILDFTIMDLGNRGGLAQANEFSSGQARIVAGCGAFETGSLQSIRSGVGLEEYGSLGDMGHVRSMFALKTPGSDVDCALLVSLSDETRIFLFDDSGDLEERDDYKGLKLDEETILATSVAGDKILQVTPHTIRLIDAESGMVLSTEAPAANSMYTAASANESFLLISEGGTTLISYSMGDKLTELGRKSFGNKDQVACLHVTQTFGTAVGIVGLWRSRHLNMHDLQSMSIIHQESLMGGDQAAVPRNIVLAQLLPETKSGPTILVSMSDGVVISFVADPKTFALSDKKSVQLGSQQVNLSLVPGADGLSRVFATSEMSSLIRGLEGHIVYSAVTAEDATVVIPFNSASFPNTIVVATNDDVRIAMIEGESLTHTKSLPLQQTVRRVAYSDKKKLFGLGTVVREFADGGENIQSEFRLVDEISFRAEGRPYQLGYLSNSPELVEAVTVGELTTTPDAKLEERFVVGTSVIGGKAGNNGRILVFGVDERKSPYLIGQYKLKGECKCLAIVDGRIVAALTKTVVVFDYEETDVTTATMQIATSYRTATAPIDIAANGKVIAVTDIMKSVCLIEYIPGENGASPKLVEIGRDMDSAWGTAVGYIEDQTWIGADGHLNLKVFKQRTTAPTLEDKHALEVIGSYHLGENVNRIRSFNVTASQSASVIPKAFLATTEGSIYMLGSIASKDQENLLTLQTKIVERAGTLGSLSWKDWRAYKSSHRIAPGEEAEEPYRFVDGEIIESFLDMDAETQAQIAENFLTVDMVRNIVEDLKRLH